MNSEQKQYNSGISAEDLARQREQRLRLQEMRMVQQREQEMQKQAYTQKMAQNVNASRQGVPKSEAQKKQTLNAQRQAIKQKEQAPKINAARKAQLKKQQKIIKKYERTSWTLLYVAAIFDDIADVLTIPIVSTALSICSSLYVNFKLWSIGSEKARNKMRLKRAGLLVLDLIPIINWIPVTTWIVYNAQQDEKKRVKKARKIIEKYSQK